MVMALSSPRKMFLRVVTEESPADLQQNLRVPRLYSVGPQLVALSHAVVCPRIDLLQVPFSQFREPVWKKVVDSVLCAPSHPLRAPYGSHFIATLGNVRVFNAPVSGSIPGGGQHTCFFKSMGGNTNCCVPSIILYGVAYLSLIHI